MVPFGAQLLPFSLALFLFFSSPFCFFRFFFYKRRSHGYAKLEAVRRFLHGHTDPQLASADHFY